jgi:hypothetical protein
MHVIFRLKICQTYIVDVFRNWKMENGVAINGPLCQKILGCTNNALVAVPGAMFGEKE